MKQEDWIKIVEDANSNGGKPILVSNHYKAPDDTWPIGIWVPLSQADFPIDYRTALQNELVIDVDFHDWDNVRKFGLKIITYLKEQRIPFIMADTGGKGLHIHIFYKITLNDEVLPLLTKAYRTGFSERNIRTYLWNEILRLSGMDINYIGKGKPFDDSAVNFSDETKGHLVREFGGRKPFQKDELGEMKWAFKTVIKDIPERKTRIYEYDKIEYPEKIEYWNVPIGKLKAIINQFLSKTIEEEKPKIIEKFEGAYTTLPCVQKLINEGNEEGQRHDGAGVIALCCALDNLPEAQTQNILKKYHRACEERGGLTQFSVKELKQWVDWFKKQPYIYFDMRAVNLLSNFGVHGPECPCKLNEKMFATAMEFLQTNNLIDEIQKQFDKEIVNEKENRMLLWFCYISAYLKERVHPQLYGETSIGKSFLLNKVLDFIPDEDVLTRATTLSPKSLNYLLAQDPNIPRIEIDGVSIPNVDGKIIVVQEFEGAQDAIIVLRPLMSGDQKGIKAIIVDKDNAGRNVIKELQAHGVPIFACASTQLQLDEEFMTRTWRLECDDSAGQTKAIMEFQAEEDIHPGIHTAEKKELLKDALRLLKGRIKEVINPYSLLLARKMDVREEYVRLRRDFKKIKEFIKISTWLHQFQRPKIEMDGKVFVVATLKDYQLVKDLLEKSFILIFEGEEDLRKLYKKAKEIEASGEDCTISKLASQLGWGSDTTRKKLTILDEKGFLLREKGFDPVDKRKVRWKVRHKEQPVFPVLTQDDLKEFYNELRTKDEKAAEILNKIIE